MMAKHNKRYSGSQLGKRIKLTKINDGFLRTVKPVLSGHSKEDQKLVLNTDYRLMQVKRAFCNTFDLHYANICL